MKKRDLRKLSPTELEKEKKRVLGEVEEEIDILGQESEDKAVKHVQEVGKREEEASKQEYDDSLNKLDLRHNSPTYSQMLVEEANIFMKRYEIPKDYTWGCVRTKEGICFYFRTPDGKWYAMGNKISMIPEYDMNGVARKVFKMLDTMDSLSKPKDEIIIK